MERFWDISNKGKGKGEILIYSDIGQGGFFSEALGAKQFAKDLKDIGEVSALDIRINSRGGSVFDGLAIMNILKSHSAEKTVYIDGIAASIASVIAMAGDKVVMPENAMLMIHDPSALAMGTADDMRKMADALDKMKKSIMTAYRDKTSLPDDELWNMMKEETWMSAEDAKEKGFADEVATAVKAAASYDLSIYKKAPDSLLIAGILNRADKPKITEKEDVRAMTVEELKQAHPDLFQAVLNQGRQEGAESERKRIQEVKAQAIQGHEDLIEAFMFDGKTTSGEAAVAILAAEKSLRAQAQAKLAKDAAAMPQVPAAGDAGAQASATQDFATLVDAHMTENKCKRSEAIRAVADKHPKAHAAYIEKMNPRKGKEE